MRIYLIFILFLVPAAMAFGQTPSEIRQQRQKEKEADKVNPEEDQPLTPSQLRARKRENQVKEKIFGDEDKDFSVNEIPEKWKNESAVILSQKMSYSFLRKGSILLMNESVRKRIKLLDKAALEDYSKFYYRKFDAEMGEPATLGIRIIKENGTVVDVDKKNAVDAEEEIPSIYLPYYATSDVKFKKLAIPDLQVGDVIDYFYSGHQEYSGGLDEYSFAPFMFTLNNKYPTRVQKIDFTIDRGFFINFNSYNGAPGLTQGTAGTDSHGRTRDIIKTFQLEDRDREKLSRDIWNFPFCTSPTIKFQVIYASSAGESESAVKSATAFVGETGQVKSSVSEDEIQAVVSRKLDRNNPVTYTDEMLKYIRKNYPKEENPRKILQLSYYYMRYQLLKSAYRDYGRYSEEYSSPKYADGYVSIDPYNFTSIILEVCKRHKIKAEAFATVPRHDGKIQDVLLPGELTTGVVAQIDGKDIFLFPCNNYSTPDLAEPELQGAEGLAFIPTRVREKDALHSRKIILPSSSFQDNTITTELAATLDDQFENLKISRKNTITGLCKKENQPLALYSDPYLMEERKKYDPKYKDESEDTRGNRVRIEEAKRKAEEEKNDRKEKQIEKLKENLKDDFDLVSYDAFELISDGRHDESLNLIYNESFTVKNLVNKAGRNYIFDAGKLIGKQLELEEPEKQRDNDIYRSYARSFSNEITITLPAGYTVEGLDDLNLRIDNESATFVSTATLEGNKIIVKTQKSYKKIYDARENWPNLLRAIEAAYQFTQKKVILKKV